MASKKQEIVFLDDYTRVYYDRHALARQERQYLEAAGVDFNSLSREELKSRLFGLRYGTQTGRMRLMDEMLNRIQPWKPKRRLHTETPQTVYLTYQTPTPIAYTVTLFGRARQKHDGFDYVVQYRDFPDSREGWADMAQMVLGMMDPAREIPPTTYEAVMMGMRGGKTALIDRFGRTATPIRKDNAKNLKGLGRIRCDGGLPEGFTFKPDPHTPNQYATWVIDPDAERGRLE